jgi:predicted Fe-Mo cluster-binding NifX family protein
MRIIVTSEGNGPKANVSNHFGRCPEFVLVEAEGDKVVSTSYVKNPYFKEHVPFAVPEFLIGLKPNVIITGGIGRRAISEFETRGVSVITGTHGTVEETVKKFLAGKPVSGDNACEH